MPQSLSMIYLHIVFSTKNRRNLITADIEHELYKYMAGILKNLGCSPIKIGGTANHIHILIIFSRNITISKVLAILKKDSSKWIKTKGNRFKTFHWQRGYGVFSVHQNGVEKVKSYIANQKRHHAHLSFGDEYIATLQYYVVDYDETYLWD